jgi:hypothetical protein
VSQADDRSGPRASQAPLAADDYTARRARALDEEIASLRPVGGLAKCGPTRTEEEIDILDSKRELADLLARKGLSNRAAAKLLGCSPSRIDGWLAPGDLRRAPPHHILRTLARKLHDREVLLDEAQSCIRAAALLRSGTDD